MKIQFNLKLLQIVSLIVLFISTSCKEDVKHDGYYISGTANYPNNTQIKLIENLPGMLTGKVIDSTVITNGHFEFKGKVNHVDYVNISVDSKYKGSFFLENSKINIALNNNSFNPIITGSKMMDTYNEIQAKISEVYQQKKYDTIHKVSAEIGKAKQFGDKKLLDKALANLNKLTPLIEEQRQAVKNIKFNFIKANTSSPIAIHVLGYTFIEGSMSRPELKEYYHLFTGDAIKTFFYKEHMTKVYKNAFENLVIGSVVPDFTLNSLNNEKVTLSEIKSNYILIDFWASWCVPCRASFPHVKELRTKYIKDSFKIVGIATADVEEKLLKAIKEDNTPWIHVFDIAENHQYGEIAKKYGVPHLPTTFLIESKTLKIILRDPRKGELDTTLEKLLGN
ncbi:AhpC/TSA family protein [Lutibacter sp. A80]|uniref:TlpA disulfide reductase family protein n=1 Tax=Lutibacter sp. A80 TaxID=2918453 RepID=UPI001F059034|nr:TlpA disulfide reductase family protein [Lutibacter sp. A80]UMB60838.1 AhpC/TSA family protein [Lutibacter sp. A80]